MKVSDALHKRTSVRAFKPDMPPAAVVRDILERAARAPSGCNLQPWRVYALAGEALTDLKAEVAAYPGPFEPEYPIYPADLWAPYSDRLFKIGADLYGAMGIARDDKQARAQQMARNAEFFGAPVGLFICIDRRMGLPQWSDLGMYMQSLMLLAVEHGLDTCAQEYWTLLSKPVVKFLNLPDELMIFSGMALGYRDETAPVNSLRTEREPFEVWGEMIGF